MKRIERIPREIFTDQRGSLSAFNLSALPYTDFKRIFVTSNLSRGQVRGAHAHRTQSQILFAMQGAFNVQIQFEGSNETVTLDCDGGGEGILIPPMTWSSQIPVTDHSVLLCFASNQYDESDYIRDWDEYLKYSNGGQGEQ